MKYKKVYMESIGYELPAMVVSSKYIDEQLAPMYEALYLNSGQLESLTGIKERRWWDRGYQLSDGAVAAAHHALKQSNLDTKDIEALVYTAVCRENFEPATACAVAAKLNLNDDANVYDISNACLGMLNGIIDIANRIELNQIKAGIVVSCETSREIVETTIQHMIKEKSMSAFVKSIATLTCGSGAAAILLTDGSFDNPKVHKLIAGVSKSAPEHHDLCRWGITQNKMSDLIMSPNKMLQVVEQVMAPDTIPNVLKDIMTSDKLPATLANMIPSESLPIALTQFMSTDSVSVLKYGTILGIKTWGRFLEKLGWARDQIDKVICHQVSENHRDIILEKLGIDPQKDFSTYEYLGNIGTVSLPLTAALADKKQFLKPDERVGFLGIGSGLNCLMIGWRW